MLRESRESMKNTGRRHKAGRDTNMFGICNCKGYLAHITRPIGQMSRGAFYNAGGKKKITKRGWMKRMRGYWKSQTKGPMFGIE